MDMPGVVSREEWLVARREHLVREKEITRLTDELKRERKRLPAVEVEKEYLFEGLDGEVSLADLFDGRKQLIVQHFMFDPEWEDGCPSCTYALEDFGEREHLHEKDTSFVVVSRAPMETIEKYRKKMGWDVVWVSSFGGDFNYDYHATADPEVAPVYVNYRDADELREAGYDPDMKGEIPGYSVFLRDGERILHTYSTFGRGVEAIASSIQFLDWTPLGRQDGFL